jgi:hypothetical protein
MLQKHGVIGGSLMLVRVARLLSKKLFAASGRASQEQLISLGDGAFGRIQEPAMSAQPVGVGPTASSGAAPLLTIASTTRTAAAPAGHFGHPSNPNG